MNFKKSGVPMDSVYIFKEVWEFSKKLERWQGFAIYSESEDSLIFQIQNSTPTSNLKETAISEAQSKNWKIQILANCQDASDVINYLGVSESATYTKDKNDLPEPPPFGEYVSVYFSHPEWNCLTKKFTTDIREYEVNGYVWDFQVVTNLNDKITLAFSGIENVPNEFNIWLKDDLVNISQDLRLNSIYDCAGRGDENPRQLKLIIGKNEFIDENVAVHNSLPDSYELCQNFPNPFNPSTTIRYSLPEAENLTLKIYNIKGEMVKEIVNGMLPSGTHSYKFNAEGLNSGIYFYKLETPSKSYVKKMMLVK